MLARTEVRMDPDRTPQRLRGAAEAAAALTLFAGIAACLSWLLGEPELTRLRPASSLVQFNTGLLFALAGGGLLAGLRARPGIAVACGGFVLLLAGATLAQYLWDVDFGIDEWAVAGTPGSSLPGRMAPNTAVTFVLAGFGMLFLGAADRAPWTAGIVQMLSALVLAIGLVALVGYALDLAEAFHWAGPTLMALYTAGSFITLGAALMLAAVLRSDAAWRETPWPAATTGVGLAALAALGWYAMRSTPDAAREHLADFLLAFGVVIAALVAGVVAQSRHLRRQAVQLGSANLALQASEAQLQLLLDSVQTAVVVHGPDSAIRYANPAAAAILGLTREQLLGKAVIDPAWHFVREDGSPMPVAEYPVSRVLARKEPLRDYIVGVRPGVGRQVRWVLVNAAADLAPDGEVRLVIVSFVDVSERQHQTRQLEQLALTDALTGLATRRHFLAEAEREVRRARRGHALSLLLLDVDHFKDINDRRGHAAGDRVLVELGRTLRAVMREVDVAGRLGGEEFAVLLPDTDEPEAFAAAERLREALAGTKDFTVSIGVATLEPGDDDPAELIGRADTAMYEAKRAGRNCTRVAKEAVRSPLPAGNPG
jgi:diguanylate cyclase (GGDEF)-like protein/PAS domain S-box-containing protein